MIRSRAKALAVAAAAVVQILLAVTDDDKTVINFGDVILILTKSQKRYLFAIYRLGQNGRPVKSTEVASVLGVTKASTVKMTQKLIDEGYIIKEPYREITLTSEGIKAANELYTPSVILQDFLENRVGVERKNAENDSVAIVSQISDDALDKLVSFALQSTTNG